MSEWSDPAPHRLQSLTGTGVWVHLGRNLNGQKWRREISQWPPLSPIDEGSRYIGDAWRTMFTFPRVRCN